MYSGCVFLLSTRMLGDNTISSFGLYSLPLNTSCSSESGKHARYAMWMAEPIRPPSGRSMFTLTTSSSRRSSSSSVRACDATGRNDKDDDGDDDDHDIDEEEDDCGRGGGSGGDTVECSEGYALGYSGGYTAEDAGAPAV